MPPGTDDAIFFLLAGTAGMTVLALLAGGIRVLTGRTFWE